MKKLTKDQMKKILGGSMDPAAGCASGDTVAHCFWSAGQCGDQAWGNCAGLGSNCQIYCVTSSGSTYYP